MTERTVVPLRERPADWIILGFFIVNLGFITYVDLERPRQFCFSRVATSPPYRLGALVGGTKRNGVSSRSASQSASTDRALNPNGLLSRLEDGTFLLWLATAVALPGVK